MKSIVSQHRKESPLQCLSFQLPPKKAAAKQIFPAIFSQWIALFYQLADAFFLGQLQDPRQTAAIALSASSALLCTALANLFGMGGAGAIAQALGKNRPQTAGEMASFAFFAGAGAAVLFSLLFAATAAPFLSLCGATKETLPFALAYAKWLLVFGGPGSLLSLVFSHLLRGAGQGGAASFGLCLGGLLNLFLDPFFILPRFLGLGAAGAGAATALSNLVSLAFFALFFARKKPFPLSLKMLCAGKRHSRAIFSMGFPSFLQYLLTVFAVSAQARFISPYGPAAMAALAICKKLDQLPLFSSIGVANGLLPLLAFSHAQKNAPFHRQAFRFGCAVSFGIAFACFCLYEAFAPQLVRLFLKDHATVAFGAIFLRCMVLAMPFMALSYLFIVQFQAMGRGKEALFCSFLRKGALDLPLLFLMDALFPLYGCLLVQPMVDALSLAVALAFARRRKKQEKKKGCCLS